MKKSFGVRKPRKKKDNFTCFFFFPLFKDSGFEVLDICFSSTHRGQETNKGPLGDCLREEIGHSGIKA